MAAPADILRFAAYHLEAGAHRLYLYLDAETEAFEALKAHPKIRPVLCDAAHWKKLIGQRPPKHQVRQMLNATHAYNRRAEVDWLGHIDVDEFLVGPVGEALAGLGPDVLTMRVRPMENLGGRHDVFKAWIPPGPGRDPLVQTLYPNYGAHLKGGFLSHVAGKIFLRTGLEGVKFRIHDAFRGPDKIKQTAEQASLALAHLHAKDWQTWRAQFDYRLAKGSYRDELSPNKPRDKGGLSMNELFHYIAETEGEAGLRAFFAEVAENSTDLRARLSAHGLLREHDLRLDAAVARHFPGGAT
ncbi:MAG: glycosyltransferase family 2 protein [Pseudomonadota bacterium]